MLKSCTFLSFTIFGCLFSMAPLPATAGRSSPPHYHIAVSILPERGEIRAEVTLAGIDQLSPGTLLYLDRDFSLQEARLDNQKIKLHLNRAAQAGPYMPHSAPLALPSGLFHTLQLRYHGRFQGMINDVNTIAPDLVELAIYSAWFPTSVRMEPFTFDLSLELPKGWGVITNGRCRDLRSSGTMSSWISRNPGSDIVILASPALGIRSMERSGAEFQIAASRELLPDTQPILDEMAAGLETASSWFGKTSGQGLLCQAFSPRKGWGYSRIPLLMSTQSYLESLLKVPQKIPENMYGVYHEMAHFWWMVAATDSPEDWINEALAEFTAWRLLQERAGPEMAPRYEANYRKNALDPRASVPIISTMEEPARYINRYEKGALLFIALERQYGWVRLQNLFRRILQEGQGGKMTTSKFLELTKVELGSEASAFLDRFLKAPGWTPAMMSEIPMDSPFS
jgi:hypothetical protein